MALRRTMLALSALAIAASLATAQEPASRPTTRGVEIAADGTITVRGRVEFIDLDGKPHVRVQGQTTVVLWRKASPPFGAMGTRSDAEITHGAWIATFATGGLGGEGTPIKVSLDRCRIEDAIVFVEPDGIALEKDTQPLFRARALPERRLRVVDPATKQHLEKVEVLRDLGWQSGSRLHPGTSGTQRIVEAEKSPVTLPPAEHMHQVDQSETLWVRAPGYAWGSIQLFLMERAEREIALERGGSLKVNVTGTLPKSESKLAVRLYKGAIGGGPVAEFVLSAGDLGTIEGLPAARYDVQLERGKWFNQPKVLAKATVDLAAGGTTTIELSPSKIEAPAKVRLCGTIVIPGEWLAERDPVSVQLDPVQATQEWAEPRYLRDNELVRGRNGEYRFAIDNVFVGRYAIKVCPGQHYRIIDVTKDPAEQLRIELPLPAEVVCRVIDRETRQPRNGVHLTWYPKLPPEMSAWSMASAGCEPNSNEVRFLAPIGLITVFGSGDDFAIEPKAVEVARGGIKLELETTPIFGVTVELYEGTVKIPIQSGAGWRVSLEPIEGVAREWTTRGENTPIVKKPGRYILRVAAPDGYKAVPDRQVELRAGAFPTIEVKVARKE